MENGTRKDGRSFFHERSATTLSLEIQASVYRAGEGTEGQDMIRSQKGIALLMVLWVITMLMTLVISFSFLTRTDAKSTIYFKEGTQEKFLAEAGMQRAIMEIYHRQTYRTETVVVEGNQVVRIDGDLIPARSNQAAIPSCFCRSQAR